MKKVIILVFVYLFLITPVFAFTIDLKVKESAGIARSSEYVTSSVPIPQSASVTSTSSLKITTDPAGNNAIPAQFEVIGRYDDEGDGGKILSW